MKKVLQKFIADSGYCSRRQAEELIRAGRVFVNGKEAELGARAFADDEVRVDKKIITPCREKVYIILNKPTGYVCTNREFKDEKNVFDLVKIDKRLFAVGRLDKNSRGLVLLTNDGELTARLTHPRYEHEKEYQVLVKSDLPAGKAGKLKVKSILESFENGIDISEGDGVARAKRIEYLGNNKFKIILTGGKKRQIRRMFAVLGLEVIDLARTRIGPPVGGLELENLKEGKWRYLSESEVKRLKNYGK